MRLTPLCAGVRAHGRRFASSACIQSCVSGYSIEVTPAAAKKVSCFSEVPGLRPGTNVNVTFLPGSNIDDTIEICGRLSSAGMQPVAHLPARSFRDLGEVEQYVRGVTGVGVNEVLVLGGGGPAPVGELTESLQILRSGLLQQYGIQRVGVAAHPEGHPDVSEEVLLTAMLDKAEWAKQQQVDLYYETQFCFEPAPVIAWEKMVRAALKERLGSGSVLPPVYVGVPGPAKVSSLIKFGAMSGVGDSLRFVQKYAGNVFKLATTSAPDQLIAGLAEYQEEEQECLLQRMHFYPFGGLKPTLRWANAVEAGQIEVAGTGFQVNH